MKVRFSKLALAELDAILADIHAHNPNAAARLNERVRRVVERIAQFPAGARETEQRPGVRRVPLVRYPYVIHYAVIDGDVMILRVIHGARRDPWE
ncbi:MAG TPA: type II toxin-antitoxin system RelE/ParE family toxin [Xanthobacteraceae bacterium]|jgi:plasmid stabilization system protein ParE